VLKNVLPERHSARLKGPSFPSQWCRFDDDKVTPATLVELLETSAQIYMALYVKRRLDYKPHITPSYVLTRESEALRERNALAAKTCAEQAQARAREVEDELLRRLAQLWLCVRMM
jgi:ubiquitin carboxyl-terminal hydrolase 22/27/51